MPACCTTKTCRSTLLFRVLLLLYVLWQIPGIFPLCSFESDALSISAGCEYTYINGWGTIGTVGYGYWMQPLTYMLIVAIKHILPQFDCETIYAGISALCALSLQLVLIVFASRMLRPERKWLLPVALWLIPESYALATYPNSTSIAGLCFVAAMVFVASRHRIPALILLVVAPMFRLDVVMIYPTLPFVLVLSGYTWRNALIAAAVCAAAVVAAIMVFYPLSGASWAHTLSEYGVWNEKISAFQHNIAVLGNYGIWNLVLIPGGIYLLFKDNRKLLSVTIVVAVMAVHLVNIRFGNACKHYALVMPFVLVAICRVLDYVADVRMKRPGVVLMVAGSLLVLSVVGVYKPLIDKMPFGEDVDNPLPVRTPSVVFRLPGRNVMLCFGSGDHWCSADEIVMFSGAVTYPWFIHNIKKENMRRLRLLEDVLRECPEAVCVTPTWQTGCRMQAALLSGRILADHRSCSRSELLFEEDGVRKSMPVFVQELDSINAMLNAPLLLCNTEVVNFEYSAYLGIMAKRGLLRRQNEVVYVFDRAAVRD